VESAQQPVRCARRCSTYVYMYQLSIVHIWYVILLRFATIDFFHFRPTNRNNTNNPPIYIYIQVRYIYVCTIRAYACVQASNVRGETAAVSSKQENITIVILSAIIIIHTHAGRDEGVSCLIQRTSGMVWKKLRKRETKRNSDDDDDNFSIILVYHHIFYRHRYKDVYR